MPRNEGRGASRGEQAGTRSQLSLRMDDMEDGMPGRSQYVLSCLSLPEETKARQKANRCRHGVV